MTKASNVGYHCWVTNLTKRDILIGDLGIKIPSMKTVDLLDNRHSILTLERVERSRSFGSLKVREDAKQITIRKGAPESRVNPRRVDISEVSFPNRARSTIKFEEKVFEELEINSKEEEEFAKEMAESAITDRTATIDLLKDKE